MKTPPLAVTGVVLYFLSITRALKVYLQADQGL